MLLAASCGATAGAFRLVEADGDRIEILGSGDGVSILVTTGRTKLLIATGTDRSAFGNAFDRVTIGPGSQPAIVLLAGSGRSLNVPTAAIDLFPDAETFAVHPLQSGSTADPELATVSALPRNPIRFTLDGRLAVVVESLSADSDGGFAWRASISRDTSRIAVISSLDHAGLFTWSDPVSTLIVAGTTGNSDRNPSETIAIIGSAATLQPPDDSAGSPGRGQSPDHILPVRPGSVATVTFRDSGIKLTSDDLMYSSG
jgi:hypothetical protein